MNQEPANTLPGVVDTVTGTVCVDLDCRRCGYNLRTLNGRSRCPECGSPVGLSTQGNFLQFADPTWVAKVGNGLQIIFVLIFIGFIVQLVAGLLASTSLVISQILGVLIGVAECYGIWLITEPDPSGIGEDKNITARKVLRVATVIALLGSLVEIGGSSFSLAGPNKAMEILFLIMIGVAGFSSLVAWFVRYTYFATIARRIPDDKLANRSLMLRKSILICVLLAVGGGVIIALVSGAPSAPGSAPMVVGLILLVPAAVGLAVFGIWTIVI